MPKKRKHLPGNPGPSEKIVRSRSDGPVGKSPRSGDASVLSERPLWSFRKVDHGGPWCWSHLGGGQLRSVLERLGNFESMPWRDIEGEDSHFIDVDSLIPSAKKRLAELGFDDVERLFSLRIQGKPRAWGLRDGHVLVFLWWDPEHQICTSNKKGT